MENTKIIDSEIENPDMDNSSFSPREFELDMIKYIVIFENPDLSPEEIDKMALAEYKEVHEEI